MEGKTARGASSPAKPALTKPEPLSHTRAVVSSSSHMTGLQWWSVGDDGRREGEREGGRKGVRREQLSKPFLP